jgi:DNA-binding Xre family transcriptional regulator
MVRLKVAELLESRGETAYALAQGAGLTLPRAYRLARAGGRFQRIEAEALDALCRYFGVQPGELLEYASGGQGGGPRPRRRHTKRPRGG